MPLTDVQLRNPTPTSKPQKLADGGGLYLELTPTGARYWRLKYRYAGKEKRLAFGVYPDVSLKEARERRDEARKLLRDGVDPGAVKKAARAAAVERAINSFEVVAREWHGKYSATWAEGTTRGHLRVLETELFPWLGGRPVGEIAAPELLAVLRRTENRGRVDTAHRARKLAGQIFRYAVATGRAERDPSGDLKGAIPPAKKRHFAARTTPKDVAEVLQAIRAYEGSLVVVSALRLVPLLFVRPGELRFMEWAEIDLEGATWSIPSDKMKMGAAHVVPLSRQAVAILEEIQPLTGTGRYVFPNMRTKGAPISDATLTVALRKAGIGQGEATIHGFRATARTLLDEVLGFRVDLIEHQLAHAVRDPNGRAYNRTAHLPERRKMMQAWSDYLDALLEGTNVVPLKRPA